MIPREATGSPMVTLEELQKSSAQVGKYFDKTSISDALHKLGVYGRVARRELWLEETFTHLVYLGH